MSTLEQEATSYISTERLDVNYHSSGPLDLLKHYRLFALFCFFRDDSFAWLGRERYARGSHHGLFCADELALPSFRRAQGDRTIISCLMRWCGWGWKLRLCQPDMLIKNWFWRIGRVFWTLIITCWQLTLQEVGIVVPAWSDCGKIVVKSYKEAINLRRRLNGGYDVSTWRLACGTPHY